MSEAVQEDLMPNLAQTIETLVKDMKEGDSAAAAILEAQMRGNTLPAAQFQVAAQALMEFRSRHPEHSK